MVVVKTKKTKTPGYSVIATNKVHKIPAARLGLEFLISYIDIIGIISFQNVHQKGVLFQNAIELLQVTY